MKRILVFLSFSLVACVAEPGADMEDTDDTSSLAVTEISSTTSSFTDTGLSTETDPFTEPGSFTKLGPGTQLLTCYQIWVCRKCGINQRRNVLQENCDDGSTTILYTGPCGQACY